MTLEETKKVLMTANALFPAWKVENPEETILAWDWALKEYTAETVMAAMQIFIRTRNSAFAPSPSELIDCMHAPKKNEQLSEGEAWALVKEAIRDGNYGSEERFNELPPLVQRAVGTPNMIHYWASCDADDVNTVIMSNFQRTYRALLSKQEFNDKIPPQLATTASAERMIEVNDT